MQRSETIPLVASLVLFFALVSASSAAPLHLTCHDSDSQVVRKGGGLVDWATCDSLVDGVCNFRITPPPPPLCDCPFVGCCGVAEALAAAAVPFVSHENTIAFVHEMNEFEVGDVLAVRPTAREVGPSIDAIV